MADKIFNVLFLCTGNSARSVMAECALNRWGNGRFRGYSAGSKPNGVVNPFTIKTLQALNYKTDALASKSWENFAGPDAPEMHFVFTVCDSAAAESCPVWPGQPMSAHWGVEDPVAFDGPDDEKLRYFKKIYTYLEHRIKIFVSLPMASLDRLTLQQRLASIGRETGATS